MFLHVCVHKTCRCTCNKHVFISEVCQLFEANNDVNIIVNEQRDYKEAF